jgi:hypothetical protein
MAMLVEALSAAIAAVLVVVLAAYLFHKHKKGKLDLEPDGATAGHAGSMLSALFLLVFAISIVVPWTNDDSARQNTYAEAGALTEAYWSAGALPAASANQIRAGLQDYTGYVATKEWPVMASGRLANTGWAKLDAVRNAVDGMQFTDKASQDTQNDIQGQLRVAYQARRQRGSDAEATLPTAVLVFVVLTGVIMIVFPFLAGARPHGMTLVPLVVMAGLLGLAIYLVFDISHTFSGGLAVKPTAFTSALQEFQRVR